MHVFENFKSFEEAELNLFQPVTLLIGPNGSGKSNLIEGVELLSHVAHGTPLYEIADVGKASGDGMEIRGGLAECPRYGTDTFTLGFSASATFDKRKTPLIYRVSIKTKSSPHICEESLKVDGGKTFIFETTGPPAKGSQGMLDIRYNNFSRGGRKPKKPVRGDRSVLSQYEEFAEENAKEKECAALVRLLRKYLKASFIFEPNPKLMRENGSQRCPGWFAPRQ